MKLTKPAISLLLHARINGAVFPFPGSNAGGATRRLAERLAKDKLLDGSPPYAISKDGLKAIETIDNRGRKMSRFYIVPYDAPIIERLTDALNGIELKAFLKTSGDTVGMLAFQVDGSIDIWRNNKIVGVERSIAAVYKFAETRGRNW